MRIKLLLIFIGMFIFAGCSQNIDQVSITPRYPENTNYVFVGDAEHQGGNSQSAQSSSAVLAEQYVGGNLTRTSSSSPSFKMTSGIGVD
jgi:uncharacterized lipoprotein YajG